MYSRALPDVVHPDREGTVADVRDRRVIAARAGTNTPLTKTERSTRAQAPGADREAAHVRAPPQPTPPT
ncbi:hypothetical protein GCM10010411_44650 [Actinomadura fulvescens]|uniref:Uncharacterized protein n=1 Tax=Actinomadura fulvescens TaxID=46160 RepID=A0ABP6CAN8_9ACTN